MSETIFDKIVTGEIPSYKVWEDDKHLAFLTPFPNSPGITILIPKKNPGDYLFNMEDTVYIELMEAAKKLAKVIEQALGVKRVALVVEGTGVAYVHIKLIPLFGELADQTDVWSKEKVFNEEYRGFISTEEGPKMDDDRLIEIKNKIVSSVL
jgi:diadenosine tetraphosphate (Ap4A) HIT family hydrolase